MRKRGNSSFEIQNVYLKSSGVVSGPLEGDGPLGNYIDKIFIHDHCNEKSWEKAEIRLVSDALSFALTKAGLKNDDIDLYIGGDLNNQLAATHYALRDTMRPFLGAYAACSTFTESILIGSTFIEAGFAKNVASVTSSHNATSERQFRYPTEYGGQKPESTTFTATGAGVCILSSDISTIAITKATIGEIVDLNQTDAQDMGRAMAPAAVMTFKQHLEDFNMKASDYDIIVTGDLSYYGKKAFIDMAKELEIELFDNYNDCGLMLYDIEKQKVFAGGSGCGCSTLVTLGYLLHCLRIGRYKKVLVIATGALHNPIMIAQKESIPCIAHAITLEGRI